MPTAAADAVVWLEENGFPGLPGRSDEVAIVTGLAAEMQTNPYRGTLWVNVISGLTGYLDDFHSDGIDTNRDDLAPERAAVLERLRCGPAGGPAL